MSTFGKAHPCTLKLSGPEATWLLNALAWRRRTANQRRQQVEGYLDVARSQGASEEGWQVLGWRNSIIAQQRHIEHCEELARRMGVSLDVIDNAHAKMRASRAERIELHLRENV